MPLTDTVVDPLDLVVIVLCVLGFVVTVAIAAISALVDEYFPDEEPK